MKSKLALSLGLGLGGKQLRGAPKFFDQTLNILWVGQSNAAKMFTDYSAAGKTACEAVLEPYYQTINSINGATAGAAIHKDANVGFGYYWDLTAGLPGPELEDALAAIDSADIQRGDIDVVVIVHGETDAEALQTSTITEAQARDALKAYIDYLRSELNNPLILLTPLGADSDGNSFTGWGIMRRVQWKLWNTYSYIKENPAYYDQTMSDDMHLNEAGYETFGERTARRILGLLGKTSKAGTLGPRVVGANFSPSLERVTVTIAHDTGTDITLNTQFFRAQTCDVDGVLASGTNGGTSRVNATTYQVNFPASTFDPGDIVKYNWPWGTIKAYTPGHVLKDNSAHAMPIRPVFDLHTIEGT